MLYFEIPRGCFWCARGINKLLSLWLSVEILIYSEIIIMSWLYYFIREQYNLLSLSGVLFSLAHRTFDTKYMFVVPPQAHPEFQLSLIQSEIHTIDPSKIRLWKRMLPHLQQLHIYVVIELKIAPSHSHLPKTRLAGLSPPLIRFSPAQILLIWNIFIAKMD